MMINSIDASAFDSGTAYVAGTRYKLGDFTPYLYVTDDYGKSWKLITDGIEDEHFTRVLRSDKSNKNILYAELKLECIFRMTKEIAGINFKRIFQLFQ